MSSRVLAALLFAAAAAGAGACAPRAQPYRFSSPMLGQADVPDAPLSGSRMSDPYDGYGGPSGGRDGGERRGSGGRRGGRPGTGAAGGSTSGSRPTYAYGWQRDAQSGIRTASAAGIELKQPDASAGAAAEVTQTGIAANQRWSHLPAPHKRPASIPSSIAGTPRKGSVATSIDTPRANSLREPADLRTLVGTRDKRDPFVIAMSWLADMGETFVDRGSTMDMATAALAVPKDGPALIAWASSRGKLHSPTTAASPGDLVVFDRATSHEAADLIGIVIARDARGVLEIAYAGGGVIRRGFVDPLRPSTRRDLNGAVVNTFLRHGKKWPPKGTRYLAGELLAHVIRIR